MKLFLTGGAGYIGSVVADHLLRAGHTVTILDNLSHGHLEAVPEAAEFVEGDIHDRVLLQKILAQRFEGLFHFAADIEAGESMQNPSKYIENNVVGSYVLFDEAVKAGMQRVVFSSTAAVYASKSEPLTETDPIKPANVYGETKHMIERLLYWYHQTMDIQVCVLRYFNAAGASWLDTPPVRGEAHIPETHIIPNILAVAAGKKDNFKLFGNDYETKDGTCVRDYIHVDDLAEAHKLGLEKLVSRVFAHEVFNLGNGAGYSNQEVLETARQVTGKEIGIRVEPRREGDAPILVASSEKARRVLGWQPKHTQLTDIIQSAWDWYQR